MQFENLENFEQLYEKIMLNKKIQSELTSWGKIVRLILDDNEFLFDFSLSPQNFMINSDNLEKSVNFTIKSKFSDLKDVLSKKIDPVESYVQGIIEIDGSIMELMEFAEILMEKINN